jgi:hypothetical protein
VSLHRVAFPSPNYSSRGGAAVRLVVIHTAEGSRTIESLGAFFANPASGVSSHVGIDDTPNTVGEYVRRDYKAWTAANFNPVAVQAELCAFAAWTPAEWNTHPTMLENCARWIAEECAAFGIPIRRLSPAEAQSGGYGVCQHVDLGTGGGNHSDCGPGFPMDTVLAIAADGRPPTPTPIDLEDTMKVVVHSDGRQFVTNGITKRYLGEPTMEAPDMLKLCDQDAPMAIADYTIDRIPEILPVVVQDTVKVDLANINRAAEDSPVAASASLAPPTPGYDR